MTVQPSVGRIVHYVSYGTPGGEYGMECRAAVVTAVRNDHGIVDICVLNPTGMFFDQDVLQNENAVERPGGTWHWPERTES